MDKNGMIKVKMIATRDLPSSITKGKIYTGWHNGNDDRLLKTMAFVDNRGHNSSVYYASCQGNWFQILARQLNKNIRVI